jgi:phage baseplate assembly protein W
MASYNIKFPLEDDVNTNRYFLMNSVTKEAYTSDLLLLLLTSKGERYYEPDYGTNLIKFIFEPKDNITIGDIEREIKETVKNYIPSLTIDNIEFNQTGLDSEGFPIGENQVNVKINFTFEEDAFSQSGELELNF